MTEHGEDMRVWVVTGPVGAGKSLATELLAGLGAEVIDADSLGHLLLRRDDIRIRLVAKFGPKIQVGRKINRTRLGQLVFADPAQLKKLNAIVHPALSVEIGNKLQELRNRSPQPVLAVIEAAVYFQLPGFGPVDRVISVTADPQLRQDRLVASGRFDAATAAARIAAQRKMLPDFDKADTILDNAGDIAQLRGRMEDLYRREFASPTDRDEE